MKYTLHIYLIFDKINPPLIPHCTIFQNEKTSPLYSNLSHLVQKRIPHPSSSCWLWGNARMDRC